MDIVIFVALVVIVGLLLTVVTVWSSCYLAGKADEANERAALEQQLEQAIASLLEEGR